MSGRAATAARSRRSVASSVNLSSTLPAACCSAPCCPTLGKTPDSHRVLAADRRQPFVNRAAIRSWECPAPRCEITYRLEHTLSRPATGSVAPRKVSCGFWPGLTSHRARISTVATRTGSVVILILSLVEGSRRIGFEGVQRQRKQRDDAHQSENSRRRRNYDFGYVLASGNTMASSLDVGRDMPLQKIGSQRLERSSHLPPSWGARRSYGKKPLGDASDMLDVVRYGLAALDYFLQLSGELLDSTQQALRVANGRDDDGWLAPGGAGLERGPQLLQVEKRPRFHRRRPYYGLQRFLVDPALCIEVPIRFGIVAAHDLSSSGVRRLMNGAATFVRCWRHFFAPAFAFGPLY
jgi:hypothetical protein